MATEKMLFPSRKPPVYGFGEARVNLTLRYDPAVLPLADVESIFDVIEVEDAAAALRHDDPSLSGSLDLCPPDGHQERFESAPLGVVKLFVLP